MASNNELEVKATPSLVEYRPPAASTQRDAWKNTADGKRNAQLIQVFSFLSFLLFPLRRIVVCLPVVSWCRFPEAQFTSSRSDVQVLQAVLPPREFQDEASGEERWQQVRFHPFAVPFSHNSFKRSSNKPKTFAVSNAQVSWDPSTRDDVIALQMKLDERLQERQVLFGAEMPVQV